MPRRILLISSSKIHGGGYLDHAEQQIRQLLREVSTVVFVPYALADHNGYAQTARTRFEQMGYKLDSIHTVADTKRAVERAESIFVGGGNTFRLLKALYDYDLLAIIRARVNAGMPYIGSSAGSNVAGPTIRTTNDMPIVEPPSFAALGLVPFQINPHYLDPDPASTHMGETREERLRQYLEENATPVVAIREPAMLRIEDSRVTLAGTASARIFTHGREPYEVPPGAVIEL